MAKGKKKKKKVVPFSRLKGSLQKKGYSKKSAGRIAGAIARKAGKAPGGPKFKPRTKAGKKRYGKK
jgi:hypothetical protein